jgi:hypothetical protein
MFLAGIVLFIAVQRYGRHCPPLVQDILYAAVFVSSVMWLILAVFMR